MSSKRMTKLAIAGGCLIVFIMLPGPLLPPQSLVGFSQSSLGLGAGTAYLLCAVAVQISIYIGLGLSAAFAVNRAQSLLGRFLQIIALPLFVAGWALTIRSLRAGHTPVLANAAVPLAACVAGVILGLS